ncbi:glycosyltransferase family 2 protein [Falsiruegeria mediterranea]|uniref:Glycosyl transferase family 2 n=1 Tax=Falsiruegeria mediterranea M17 TaxID=1200281 RepID=A0A2R8CFI6_9RHOB|nr:glycosyltransferase family 2 protein [Falsiruegeria mediterranea]SPJ31214.1 hypothetical protein TRM7615_04757 [Falsiruegeria mediterranea M17]
MAKQATWSIVTIAREPAEVIRRFVAWHLHQGAARIVIHFDDPNDPCVDMVSHLPQVEAVRCTPEFWSTLGVSRETRRMNFIQNAVRKHGYDRASEDWIFPVDADEFVYAAPGRSITELLTEAAPEERLLQIRPAEIVTVETGSGHDVFRLPMEREDCKLVYRDFWKYMARNKGLAGHNAGKSFIRGQLPPFKMRPHWIETPSGEPIVDRVLDGSDGFYVLHYVDSGYEDWRRKLEYRVRLKGYRPRLRTKLADVLATGDEAEIRRHYELMHSFDNEQADVARTRGLLLEPELDFDPIVSRYF